jgi:DNA-directed RNA polymerase subunit RPC12/RpoP
MMIWGQSLKPELLLLCLRWALRLQSVGQHAARFSSLEAAATFGRWRSGVLCGLMTAPLIYYKPCTIGDTYFRECLTCGAIVKNEGLHTLYHEQQTSPKRCPKCGLLDIGRHICPKAD